MYPRSYLLWYDTVPRMNTYLLQQSDIFMRKSLVSQQFSRFFIPGKSQQCVFFLSTAEKAVAQDDAFHTTSISFFSSFFRQEVALFCFVFCYFCVLCREVHPSISSLFSIFFMLDFVNASLHFFLLSLLFFFCKRISPFSLFIPLFGSDFFFGQRTSPLLVVFACTILFCSFFLLQQEEQEYKEAQKALRRQSRHRRRRSNFRRKGVGEAMKEREQEAEADLKASQKDGMKDAAAYREVRASKIFRVRPTSGSW